MRSLVSKLPLGRSCTPDECDIFRGSDRTGHCTATTVIPDRHPVVTCYVAPTPLRRLSWYSDPLPTPPPDAISLLARAIEEAVVMNQVAVPRLSSPSMTYRQRSVSYSLTRVSVHRQLFSILNMDVYGVLHIDGFFVSFFFFFFEKITHPRELLRIGGFGLSNR